VAATHGETSALATSLFSATDADHNTITQYAFWDTGGNGHWAINGVAQLANTEIDVSAANLWLRPNGRESRSRSMPSQPERGRAPALP
jgi:hypothetical protein